MKSELTVELKNLPQQGLSFSYNEKSKELGKKLKPLIGDNSCRIEGHIQSESPSSYTITGSIQTQMNLSCARCAYDFKQSLNKKFKEKIFVQKSLERIDKTGRSNHFSELENQESFTLIDNSLFNLGEFLYELTAVEEPLRPLESKSCDQSSSPCRHLKDFKERLGKKSGRIHFAE